MGDQSYVLSTFVFPIGPPAPIMQRTSHPRTAQSSYPTMDVTSYHTMRTPGYSPYGTNATSASSSVSEFGSSVQEYQIESSTGYSAEHTYPPLIVSPARYADASLSATGHHNPNAANDNGAGSYSPRYYAGHYGFNWCRTWLLIGLRTEEYSTNVMGRWVNFRHHTHLCIYLFCLDFFRFLFSCDDIVIPLTVFGYMIVIGTKWKDYLTFLADNNPWWAISSSVGLVAWR